MTKPVPEPPTGASPADWPHQIETLLDRSRGYDQTGPHAPPPSWLPRAVDLIDGWARATIAARVDQATTHLQTQLDEARRDSHTVRYDLHRLRTAIRLYLADVIASGDRLDRGDANAVLLGWCIDPLPARFAVTLTATITVTLVADDADEAATQAQRLLDDLPRDTADETVTIAELHTDDVVELDEPVDPVTPG
jgi:hypothetical protein